MSTTYEITVSIKANGRVLPGFPRTDRVVAERSQDITREHAAENATADLNSDYLPAWDVDTLTGPKVMYITADGTVRVHSKTGDTDSLYPIVLAENGYILAVNMDASDVSNASFGICNASTATVERTIVLGDD